MEVLQSLQANVLPLLCRPLFTPNAYTQWAVVSAIAAPHFLYAWIWMFPKAWQSMFGDQSVDVFALLATFGKVVQFEAAILWVWSSRPQGLCPDPSSIMLWQWLAFVLLVAFGQKLNVGIFQAIGVPGVYYGFKLGKSVPWVTGFPFNVVSHPQYVGSVMTVWGVAAMLYSQMPQGSELQIGVVLLASYWSLLYLATGLIEQYL